MEQLTRVHPENYVAAILGIRPEPDERVALDGDTIMSWGSAEAALRAAGAAVAAVDAVMKGEFRRAFCATRPPGHHCEPGRPMGFCLFANAAIAARHAQAAHGAARVAVVDFDVHHGNGTQACFEADASLFYACVAPMAALSRHRRRERTRRRQHPQRHAAAGRGWRGVPRRLGGAASFPRSRPSRRTCW